MKQILFLALVCLSLMQAAAQKKGAVLNHIAQYVTDLKRGTAFYQQVIGLDTIPEPFHDGKHTWFKIAGHAQLHLIEGATAPSPLSKNSHLCFSVPSLSALIKKLDAARIPYEDWAGKPSAVTLRKDGVHQIYFKDPDGYWIEANDDRY
jgi:lactoylglutathione lyase